jgi:hypothetical protein
MQRLAVLATAASTNDSEGDTNLGTIAAGPIDLTNGTSARKERCRKKILPFVTHFWSTRKNEEDNIDHKKEANNKRMANYWMVRELERGGVTTLEELKEYMIVSIIYYIYIYIYIIM